MLVLSRRLNERILIPEIGAAVEILDIKRSAVRLGINAPSEVAVVRERPDTRPGQSDRPRPAICARMSRTHPSNRIIRRRLKQASIQLGLARLQLSVGLTSQVDLALARLHREIQQVRRCLGGRKRLPARTRVAASHAETQKQPAPLAPVHA